MRESKIHQKTLETEIRISINLDGVGKSSIRTGLGFIDHMLTNFSFHGLFDLDLDAKGDLHVDPHHTVEDCALALGAAFDKALGDRTGIVRMASEFVPMDESLAFASVDFSGRPYTVVECDWSGPAVGGIAASLWVHFFESFAIGSRSNVHLRVLYGRDDHHKIEAVFKAFGRALMQAVKVEPRRDGRVPSTKGVIRSG